MRLARILLCVFLFLAGFVCGAASFIGTQSRPVLFPRRCEPGGRCISDAEVLGLLTSAGLHVAPGLMPDIIARSADCVGIRSPRPEARVDLVFFPLRDMRDLLDLAPGDEPYLSDCFALMRDVAHKQGLHDWKVVTNGPGQQEIAYLHFHLIVQ
jgi:hypothetical protein